MRVFKYRSGSADTVRRDLRTLAANRIYASGFEFLNDLFEARVQINGNTFRVAQTLSSLGLAGYPNSARLAEDQFISTLSTFETRTKSFGVYSLSQTPTDELLWAHYGDSHRGFCLEYDLETLLKYKLKGEGLFTVAYDDHVPTVALTDLNDLTTSDSPLLKKFIGTKSRRWEYEREIRVVTGEPGLFEYDFRALKAIYFGARASVRLKRMTMRLMAGRGLVYYEVHPTDGTYKLQPKEVPDPHFRPVVYRKRVAPVESGVPYLGEKLEAHRPIIERGIEIVRRDPYCEKVIDAYLSSRGTTENPIYYITYIRSDDLPQNYFISKNEIEAWRQDA
jgi:Protein of unknown function (DUF2971)